MAQNIDSMRDRREARRGRRFDPRAAIGSSSSLTRLFIITVAIFIAVTLLNPSQFLSAGNLSSMAFQFPEFAILSLAMMVAMLTGGIDLSIVGIANLSAILAALLMSAVAPGLESQSATLGLVSLAVVVALSCGAGCGIFNGLAISYIGIPPILATVGSGLMFTGLGIVLTNGAAVLGLPGAFATVGNGSVAGVPVPLLIFLGLAGLVALLLIRTAFGLKVYMMGTNPLTARFAGIDNARVTITVYALSGMLAAAAGLVIASRANSAKAADYGSSYLLLTVLIAVLGGINPYGGFGRVAGLILAVLSLQFLSSGLNLMQVSQFAEEFIWGALLLLVMVVNTIDLRRKGKTASGSAAGRKAPTSTRE